MSNNQHVTLQGTVPSFNGSVAFSPLYVFFLLLIHFCRSSLYLLLGIFPRELNRFLYAAAGAFPVVAMEALPAAFAPAASCLTLVFLVIEERAVAPFAEVLVLVEHDDGKGSLEVTGLPLNHL